MPVFTSFSPGTPSWVDLASPDLDVSSAFYRGLFGWEAETSQDPAAGGYTMFTLRGKNVAGMSPLMAQGQPPVWSTYITVEDVDKTCALAIDAGGVVAMAPMDVLTVGRMGILQDPTGAFVCLWQPGERHGADLATETGAFCWNELDTRDIPAARAFYSAVFGWEITGSEAGGPEYYEAKVGGSLIAGMMPMPPTVPEQVPAFWLTYFAVENTDAAADAVVRLGGQVMMPATDIPAGRFAIVAGPNNEPFGIITLPPAA